MIRYLEAVMKGVLSDFDTIPKYQPTSIGGLCWIADQVIHYREIGQIEMACELRPPGGVTPDFRFKQI
jgi:hypothetical protein